MKTLNSQSILDNCYFILIIFTFIFYNAIAIDFVRKGHSSKLTVTKILHVLDISNTLPYKLSQNALLFVVLALSSSDVYICYTCTCYWRIGKQHSTKVALAREPIPKKIGINLAFHDRPAQIPGYRCDSVILLPRPLPPPFSTHRRINAPLQVQSTTAFAGVSHTALSLVFKTWLKNARARYSPYSTSDRRTRFSLSRRDDARYEIASRYTQPQINHVTLNISHKSRFHFSFSLTKTLFSLLNPSFPIDLLEFAHPFCLLAESQTQHETGTYARLVKCGINLPFGWSINKA